MFNSLDSTNQTTALASGLCAGVVLADGAALKKQLNRVFLNCFCMLVHNLRNTKIGLFFELTILRDKLF